MSQATPLVPPRVFLPGQSSPVRLDRAVAHFLDIADDRPIHIQGPLGFGITTAVEYVRRSFADRRDLFLIDESARMRDWFGDPHGRRVIIGSVSMPSIAAATTLRLAPWTRDDLIAYLLLVAPKLCGNVMGRIEPSLANDVFAGYPALWTVAIDEMLMDESVVDPIAALDRCIDRHCPGQHRETLKLQCFLWLAESYMKNLPVEDAKFLRDASLIRKLFRCRPFQLLLACDAAIRRLTHPASFEINREHWPPELIARVGELVGQDSLLVDQILHAMPKLQPEAQPIAASVLTNGSVHWELPVEFLPKLDYANLHGVNWSHRNLRRLSAVGADFSDAALTEIRLDHADLHNAMFVHATLGACGFAGAVLEFLEADHTRINRCDFASASLVKSSLSGATVERCNFVGADFAHANLGALVAARNDFSRVEINTTNLHEARFTDCRFIGAQFKYVSLQSVRFRHCCFDASAFWSCDLQGVEILEAAFRETEFDDCDLSGTHLPGASFHRAKFADGGVMNASWPGSDLTHADLRGLMFHAGSSRSGLIGSPLASEGTRTGFYTDESLERSFREPEEIRRADLRGCDLRGANLEGVDFYLVDLRGAKLDEDQVAWLQQCRAILTPT